MSSNVDTTLHSLAAEINALGRQRQGKMIEMGHKLIEVRAILRELYGDSTGGSRDGLGLKAPLGWKKWVSTNLEVTTAHVSLCIKYALDPTGESLRNGAKLKEQTTNGHRAFSSIKTHWDSFSDENKRRITEFVFARWQEERTRP